MRSQLDEDDAFARSVLEAARRANASSWIDGKERDFVEFVRERSHGAPSADAEVSRIEDFALVFGCLDGHPDALRTFDTRISQTLGSLLRRESDLKQDLLTRLFLPSDSRGPRALRFAGTGPLAGWVRRTAVNLVRSSRRARSSTPPRMDVPDGSRARAAGPEDDYLTHERTGAFMTALADAVQTLSRRDRELLRLQGVEHRSVQEIAAHFEVHRETAGRWLESARTALARETRARLRQALGVDAASADAVISASIEAGMASLGRILTTRDGGNRS